MGQLGDAARDEHERLARALRGRGLGGASTSRTIAATNKAFSEWNHVFDSAACVVTLIDRLGHRADIVEIEGESYRAKEAQLSAKLRRDARRTPKP